MFLVKTDNFLKALYLSLLPLRWSKFDLVVSGIAKYKDFLIGKLSLEDLLADAEATKQSKAGLSKYFIFGGVKGNIKGFNFHHFRLFSNPLISPKKIENYSKITPNVFHEGGGSL